MVSISIIFSNIVNKTIYITVVGIVNTIIPIPIVILDSRSKASFLALIGIKKLFT